MARDALRFPRVLVVGGTGYIGKAVVRELVRRGHDVTCIVRPKSTAAARENEAGAKTRVAEVTDAASLVTEGICGERFDAVVSCLASRSGAVADSWRVERDANHHVLGAARAAGARHFVLLSAICVQKPKLAFQYAKLAFEDELVKSGIDYSIVRPTAFFKSLSGQIENVKNGKPFIVFGNGALTACKPISEADVARFLVDSLRDDGKRNAILPIGGPGPALTPREQGALLFELCGKPPRYRHVPVAMMSAIIGLLSTLGLAIGTLRGKAQLAKIGRYYATESMLVWDAAAHRYDADATPSYGQDTLRDFYAHALEHGLAGHELGEQAVFARRKRPAHS